MPFAWEFPTSAGCFMVMPSRGARPATWSNSTRWFLIDLVESVCSTAGTPPKRMHSRRPCRITSVFSVSPIEKGVTYRVATSWKCQTS